MRGTNATLCVTALANFSSETGTAAAARILTNTRSCEHITPVLSSLHCLPVHFRINFKLLFVFKAINTLVPLYLSKILTICHQSRAQRSSGQLLCEAPVSHYKQWGDRSFSVAAPRNWNKLPPDTRTTTDVGLFKSKLKTNRFKVAFSRLS